MFIVFILLLLIAPAFGQPDELMSHSAIIPSPTEQHFHQTMANFELTMHKFDDMVAKFDATMRKFDETMFHLSRVVTLLDVGVERVLKPSPLEVAWTHHVNPRRYNN